MKFNNILERLVETTRKKMELTFPSMSLSSLPKMQNSKVLKAVWRLLDPIHITTVGLAWSLIQQVSNVQEALAEKTL
jgi:hypothetical protein